MAGFLGGAVMVCAAVSEAVPVTWNLYSGSGVTSTNTDATPADDWGNVRTFTVGGVTVTATAWSLTGNGDTTFETGQLGRFSTGLGACNRDEGEDCGSPSHQVDNVGADDFVLFQFSVPVDPTKITIDPYGTWDRDVSYWVGNAAAPLNLTGRGLGNLAGLGFGSRIDDDDTESGNPLTIDLTSGVVNSLLFSASLAGYNDNDDDDRFKIKSLKAELVPTPEPGTLALLGTGLVSAGLSLRRRLFRK